MRRYDILILIFYFYIQKNFEDNFNFYCTTKILVDLIKEAIWNKGLISYGAPVEL